MQSIPDILTVTKEMIPLKQKKHRKSPELFKTYITQPISQADARQKKTDVALPNEENVERNREWIEENEK